MTFRGNIAMLCFTILAVSLRGLSFTESDENGDIITILNHIKAELRDLKRHAQSQDRRGTATEKAVELLTEENVELRKALKEHIKDLKGDINHAKEQVRDLKEYVQEQVKDVKDVKRKIEIIKQIQHDIEIMKEVATTPLPGKTWEKPSASCNWLNQRYYHLPDGKYWTKVNGHPKYTQCSMNNAGIPPVRCSSKPCHANAVCEDIDVGVKCKCNCGYTGNGKECQRSFKPLKKGKGKMLITEACPLNKNNILTTFKYVAQDYLVRFEIYPTMFEARETLAPSVLHFTTGGDCCNSGRRVPAVWILPVHDQLYMCSSVNGNGDYRKYGNDTKVPLHQWSTVEIKQKMSQNYNHVYSITINDRKVLSVVNTTPREFKDVKLYVSDPWYPDQKGNIRNLYVEGYE